MSRKAVLNSPWWRALLVAVVSIAFGATGFHVGEAVGYLIAYLTDREPAELKGMLICCYISGPPVMAALGLWLSLRLSGAGLRARRLSLGLLAAVLVAATAFVASAFDWPKDSGTPVIEYELRFPPEVEVSWANRPEMTVWSGNRGQGCYVGGVQTIDGRIQINGHIVIKNDDNPAVMSVGLRRPGSAWHAEGYWKLPYSLSSKLQPQYTPWQPITFIVPPREVSYPLPAGSYEIRYRIRHYM